MESQRRQREYAAKLREAQRWQNHYDVPFDTLEQRQSARPRGLTATDPKRLDAEAYMRRTNAEARQQTVPLTEQALKRSSTRSEGDSARSKASSRGERSSRLSNAGTNVGADGIRLNIDTSAGFNFNIDGDMEGRTINMVQRPGEQIAELVIGSSRRETEYSIRGSKVASRESDTKSKRSSKHIRRDHDVYGA